MNFMNTEIMPKKYLFLCTVSRTLNGKKYSGKSSVYARDRALDWRGERKRKEQILRFPRKKGKGQKD